MLFKFVTPEVIKSVTQRALASYWDRLAAGRAFPAFTEFEPDATSHDPKQLVVWNIEGAGPLLKFRALYQGANVAEVFNSSCWTRPRNVRRAAVSSMRFFPRSMRMTSGSIAKGFCCRSDAMVRSSSFSVRCS